jgi:hypothetical protein
MLASSVCLFAVQMRKKKSRKTLHKTHLKDSVPSKACTSGLYYGPAELSTDSVGVFAVVPAQEHGQAPPEDVEPGLVLLQRGAAPALPLPRRRPPAGTLRRRRDEVAVRRAHGIGDGGGRQLHVANRSIEQEQE